MYISRPCALGRKQSNEGLGVCSLATSGEGPAAQARVCVPASRPGALALLSQLLVFDAVRAPRQRRLQGAALGLRGFGKELENRREALPGSELVTVGACKKHRLGYEGPRAEPAQAAGPPAGAQAEPPPRPAPRARGPSRPHLYLRVHAAPGSEQS